MVLNFLVVAAAVVGMLYLLVVAGRKEQEVVDRAQSEQGRLNPS